MLFYKQWKSKKLAEEVATEYKGKIEKYFHLFSNRYSVQFKYKKMQVHGNFRHPYSEFWIQNFQGPPDPDFGFSFNESLPIDGITISIEKPFNYCTVPVFAYETTNIASIMSFLGIRSNEDDLHDLCLSQREHLIVFSSQIILRNRKASLDNIQRRLDILSRFFTRSFETYGDQAKSMIDPLDVPDHLQDLIPLAEKWGIGDDSLRKKIWDEAMIKEKEALKAALRGRTKEITDCLDAIHGESFGSTASGYFMWLLEGLDEAGLWPD